MVTVFLVEDELLIRKSIRENIDWDQEGFQFVGEAADGELALPLIKQLKPNIVITDVKMPFMDGLELSAIIRQELPQTKIVILSGFREFEYAKKAISLGVTEYLSKPITSDQLLQVIKKIKVQIEEEQEDERLKQTYQQEMKSKFNLERNQFLTKLLQRNIPLTDLLNEAARLNMDMVASRYNIMFCHFKPIEDSPESWTETQKASSRALQFFSQDERFLQFERGFDGIALILKGPDEATLCCLSETAISALRTICQAFPRIEYFGGIGMTVNRLSDMYLSYQTANKAFSTRFFSPKNQIVYYEDAQSMKLSGMGSLDIRIDDPSILSWKPVEDFFMAGTMEETINFAENYMASLGMENCKVPSFRLHIAMNTYFCALAFADKTAIDQQRLLEAIGTPPCSIESPSDLTSYLHTILIAVLDERDKLQSKRYSLQIAKAKEYILAHAQEYGLSLNTVAEQAGMSPNYFSSVFSQEMGKTFIEYLTEVRMDKARQLLCGSTMRASDIAPLVGYQDPHYFGFLFKKVVGCSPKEYRQRMIQND